MPHKTLAKLAIGAMFATAATAAPVPAPDAAAIDLYVFAGQSNMKGHVATLTSDFTGPKLIPSPYREAFAAPVSWALQWNSATERPDAATDAARAAFGTKFVPYRAAHDPSGDKPATWGPEVAFLFKRHQAGGKPLYFVKYAIGGTAVSATATKLNWNAATRGDAALLPALTERTRRAARALQAMGYPRVDIHLVWAQGESDPGSFGRSYLADFTALLGAFKAGAAGDGIGINLDSMTLIANAASAYTAASINIAATRLGAQLVNVRSYPRALFIADNLHLGPAGQVRHGEEIELLTRTRPRAVASAPAGEGSIAFASTALPIRVRIPALPAKVLFVPTIANGGIGLELLGDTAGLALDALNGGLGVTDPALIRPGVRQLSVRRHNATGVTSAPLAIDFIR